MHQQSDAVLDKGFAYLVEKMGDDRSVVQAARVCYRSDGAGDAARDMKLLTYLMTHDHLTPFEHVVLKFHVKAPIFVARQWFRHRSSSYNEVSGRYTEMKDEFYVPERWRAQDKVNKQGSVAADLPHDLITRFARTSAERSYKDYRALLELGVSKEMARFVLPVNLYTEWYWTINARNLMAFFRLRCDDHAQWETRQYANAMWEIFRGAMPVTAAAFLDTLPIEGYDIKKGETIRG